MIHWRFLQKGRLYMKIKENYVMREVAGQVIVIAIEEGERFKERG